MSRPAIMEYIAGIPDRMDYYREVAALDGMAKRDVNGFPIVYAYGGDFDPLSPSSDARVFGFDVEHCQRTRQLILSIDAYRVNRLRRRACGDADWDKDTWDVDQWEAGKILLYARPTRIGFLTLARVARVVISGRTAEIDGRLTVSLDGITSTGADL